MPNVRERGGPLCPVRPRNFDLRVAVAGQVRGQSVQVPSDHEQGKGEGKAEEVGVGEELEAKSHTVRDRVYSLASIVGSLGRGLLHIGELGLGWGEELVERSEATMCSSSFSSPACSSGHA